MSTSGNNVTNKQLLTTEQKIDILLEKFDTFDTKLTGIGTRLDVIEKTVSDQTTSINRIDGVLSTDSNRIKDLEDKQDDQTKSIEEVKSSAEFISKEFENMKLKVAEIDSVKTENVHLKKRIDDLSHDVLQEKVGRNIEQQYLRTSLNIKLCGVPAQTGEDVQTKSASNPVTLEVLKQVALQTDMLLPPSSIDVCHRLGSEPNSPIIIRFTSKSARFNFVSQKGKLKNFTSADLDLSGIQIPKQILELLESKQRNSVAGRGGSRGGSRGGFNNSSRGGSNGASSFGGGGFTTTSIYLQDHLTKRNKDLLREAKDTLKGSFEFPGYVYHGEIRAKQNTNSKHHVIYTSADIQKLSRDIPND